VIVGLETLPDFGMLASIEEAVGSERVVFSLDLRNGQPIATAPELAEQSPQDLAARAADAGVIAMLTLDLARVGSASGLDLDLLEQIRARVPALPLYVGGGVRSMDDLRRAQSAGCDGALIASALLDGTITEQDLRPGA
jgi:phosphoribosylformimino-5-aminoimidazole carboxamide ribotide isomerase